MYCNLIENMRRHNSINLPTYRSQMFKLSQEIPLITNLIRECSNRLSISDADELMKSSLLLKSLRIPQMLIDDFIALSYNNTENEIETLGILAGYTDLNSYEVCGLVIPKQKGCGDSCECLDDESLFNCLDQRGWQIFGWIHTHPNHDLFLSSIDLHTHAGYQWFFPEAIALVFAPTHPKQIAAFRLSTNGLSEIRKCGQKGFHPHSRDIYKEASNVEIAQGLEFIKIDLR
jgi:proteasome lid subunit RPN8/RPN11